MNEIAFACPYCFDRLDDELMCGCGFKGFKKSDYYCLYRNDESWQECEGQKKAVEKATSGTQGKETVYTRMGNEEVHTDNVNKYMHDKCIELMGGVKDKVFLDIGGQTGWASKRFIDKGARYGALIDIEDRYFMTNPDSFVNVLGNGYHLPFCDNQFDFVFDCSSLHHFIDKSKLMKEIYRVLKDGGCFVNQGNRPRPQGHSNDAEKKYMDDYGLIETWQTKEEYDRDYNEIFSSTEYHPIREIDTNMVVIAYKNEGCEAII